MSWYPAIWYIWLLLIIVGFFFRKEAELGINTASVGFIMVLTAAGGATSFAQSLLRTLHLNHIFKGEGQAIVFGGVLLILYFVGNFIYKKTRYRMTTGEALKETFCEFLGNVAWAAYFLSWMVGIGLLIMILTNRFDDNH